MLLLQTTFSHFFLPTCAHRLIHFLHGLLGSGDLSLHGRRALLGAVFALQNSTAVVRQLQLCNLDVRGVNTDRDSCTVCLFAASLFDVNHPLQPIAGSNLTLTTLPLAALHHNFVILSDRKRTHMVLASKLLGQGGTHEDTAHMARGLEMSTAGFATRDALGRSHLSFTEREAGL